MGRVGPVVNLIFTNFEKATNYYLKLMAIRNVGRLLMELADQDIASLLLQMLKHIPVVPSA